MDWDNIERARQDTRVESCRVVNSANPQHGIKMDFETYSRAPFLSDQPLCPDCLQFGTICRPCRAARYEAHRRVQAAAYRRVVRMILAATVLLLCAGLLLQYALDRHCGAGLRWDAERWQCLAAQ